MKDLRAIRGLNHISQLIEQGEHERQDFKFSISDARKIARTVSAFANNSGGCMLIGVKDNGTIAGVRNDEDIYVVEQGAQMYCQPPVEVTFQAYRTQPGCVVIKATVPRVEHRPVYVREHDGTLHAYFRVADENITAPAMMVRAWELESNDDAIFFSTETASVLAAVDNSPQGSLSPDRLPYASHLPLATSLETGARLIAAGVLRLVHTPGGFLLERTPE